MAESQIDISRIGVPGSREQKAIHLAAWTQAKVELSQLLSAIIPTGGSLGQVLTKASATSFDMVWQDPSGEGGGGGVPFERMRPEDFGYEGTGDASSAIQDAINEAQGDPTKVLWLTNTYPVNALVATDALRVDGGGTLTPFDEPSSPLLSITRAALTNKTISAFLDTTIDLSNGDGITTTVTRLTVSNTTSLLVGQIVRITSTDATTGVAANKRGRAAMIISIDTGNNYVYLDRILDLTFTTSPKMWVYDDAMQTVIENINFTVAQVDAFDNDWDFDYLYLEGLVTPIVRNLFARNITNSGLFLAGCVTPIVDKSTFLDGRNRADLSIPGYGIQDAGSHLTKITSSFFRNVRHGVTTIGRTTDNNNPWTFGGTYGLLGQALTAQGCGSAAFDTHPDAALCGYSQCQAAGGWGAFDSAMAGFQLRGDQCFVSDCQAEGTEYGIILHASTSGENVRPHIVSSFRSRARKAGVRIRPTQPVRAIMMNLDLESQSDRNFDLSDVNLLVMSCLSRILGTSPAHFIINTGSAGSILKVEGGTYDTSATAGVDPVLVQITGTDHVLDLECKVLTESSEGWSSVVESTDGEDVTAFFKIQADRTPTNTSGVDSIGSGSIWAGRVLVGHGATSDNSIIQIASTGGNRTLSEHINCLTEEVVLAFNCTVATTNINAADASLLMNQRVTVVNRAGSTQDLVLKHQPASKMVMQSDRTLAPGAGATLVWNPVDAVFNLASSPLSGTGGIAGINIALDGVNQDTDATTIDFEADDFSWSGTQVTIDTTNIPRNTWTADQNAADHVLTAPLFKDTADTEQSVSSSAGAITLNHANGNIIVTTQSENIGTITISNFPTGGWMEWWVIRTNTSHTITWPASFRWPNNTAPTLSALGNVDKFFITKRGSLYDVAYELGFPST